MKSATFKIFFSAGYSESTADISPLVSPRAFRILILDFSESVFHSAEWRFHDNDQVMVAIRQKEMKATCPKEEQFRIPQAVVMNQL